MKLTAAESLALGGFAVLLGLWLRRLLPFLERWSIPAGVAGGLAIALCAVAYRAATGVGIENDGSLRDLLSMVCFTIIGLNASFRVLLKGGLAIPLMLLLAGIGAALQNLAGGVAAKLLGLNPLIGPLAGSISLCGGPATSVAFGAEFEKQGVVGATSVAVASATFGIAVAGLLAGRVGDWLIERFHAMEGGPSRVAPAAVEVASVVAETSGRALLPHLLAICLCIGAGVFVNAGLQRVGVTVPSFIGPMTVAAAWRNFNDRRRWQDLSEAALSEIFQCALPLFIGVAISGLRLWEIASLAVPLVAILLMQVALTCSFGVVVFLLLRRYAAAPYESAVMSAGFVGFMLGITPNAMASMGELTERRKREAPQAFLALPMVGGYLNDWVNSAVISASKSLLSLLH